MFTMKDFMNLEILPWIYNLTDESISQSRPIEYVSVNALPLDNFIRKNEMVLCIATPYAKEDELMLEFIAGLVDAKASAFVLTVPEDTIVLSEKAKKLASDNRLPVLLIPWSVRIADLCEKVLEKIHENYNLEADLFKEMQTELLEAFLKNETIETATNIISRSLNCTVAIVDLNNTQISGRPLKKGMTQLTLESDNCIYGYLYLDTKKTEKGFSLLRKTLSPLMTLWFYKDELIEASRRVAKDDFIWSLANGSDPKSEDVIRTAKLMNFQISRSYSCITGRIRLRNSIDEEYSKQWIESNIGLIKKELLLTAKSLRKEIMTTYQNGILVVFLENTFPQGKAQISKFIDTIEKKLQYAAPNVLISWGVSEIKEGPANFRAYFSHAKLAMELCADNTAINNCNYYENTILFHMMSTLLDDKHTATDAHNIIAPLIEYDSAKKSNKLMNTLKAYLTYKSISKTARALQMHRQTLLYQLNKIEELTGLSLKNNNELFLLEICMRLYTNFQI